MFLLVIDRVMVFPIPYFQKYNIIYVNFEKNCTYFLFYFDDPIIHRCEVKRTKKFNSKTDFLMFNVSASSPEPRQCPYLGKFTVTSVNRNQRNIREDHHTSDDKKDESRIRHSDDRRGHAFDFDTGKKRANNEYLRHETSGRGVRSERTSRAHDSKVVKRTRRKSRSEGLDAISRTRWSPVNEDFNINPEILGGSHKFSDFEDESTMIQIQDDYFGDYKIEKPEKRSNYLSYEDILRFRKDVESDNYDDDFLERREKREEENTECTSEVTTLNVGCSTADRMEFQNDCIDENDAITAYSCHGRWFDAEGTQFVIATPLAHRTSWPNENNEPQAFHNSRRLCFMYRENGGVVSLTASTIACQREILPSPPMLAFNATSIGQCMEDNGSQCVHSIHLLIMIFVTVTLQVLR
uniref:C2orf16 protein n=1 Tax=Fopius arisanus TaxID=64838 RepID=A0A0C9QTR0_9HYME